MKFYDCSTAPSSRLVRMFIAEKGLDIPTQEVDLRNKEQLSEAFREVNPYCTVPVLETDEGERFTSTQGCWRYLEEKFSEPALLGTTPEEKARIADLVWRIEMDGFHAGAEALRNVAKGFTDRAIVGPDNYAQIPELGVRGRQRAEKFLERFDGILEGREYLAGNQFSAADILAFVVVDFVGWIKLALPDDANNARRWYEAIAARPSASL